MLLAQDLYVLLKLACIPKGAWTFRSLADALHLSVSQVHAALRRAASVGLYSANKKALNTQALEEFVVHGAKYAYPPERGTLTQGMATAYLAPPLNKTIVSAPGEPGPVWPFVEGERLGYSIKPLHPSAPSAALEDSKFYELLALVDALREGRARERHLAEEEIQRRLRKRDA